MKERFYAILKQEEFESKYGGTAIKVLMVCLNDRQLYHTYIDHRMMNFENWGHILRHPERGYVISGVKIKNKEKSLINADSDPLIFAEFRQIQEMFDEIAGHLK